MGLIPRPLAPRPLAPRRWARVPVAVGLVLAAVVAAQTAWAAPALRTQASVSLFASDGGRPLFTLTDLRAGEPHSACVDVTVANAIGGDTVSFTGQDVTGALAEYLIVTVLAGPPVAGDCDSFTGARVFQGSLAALGAGAGLMDWQPARDGATWRFRLTVMTSPDAPSVASAQAGFAWNFQQSVAVTPVIAAAPPGRGLAPRPNPPAPRLVPPGLSPAPQLTLGRVAQPWFSRALVASRDIAVAFLRHSQYPLGLLLLAILFLAAQNAVDRRDPKLALAPVRNDDLRFPDKASEVVL